VAFAVFTALGLALLLSWPAAATARAKSTPASPAGDRMLRLMALNMYHEAMGEGAEGMIAVGWVVLNRIRDPRFPDTVTGVITDGGEAGPCQWSWYCDGRPDTPQGRPWRLALEVARRMLGDPPPDPTNGALWFQLSYTNPPPWQAHFVARVGEHDFYGR
jgi:spore germination cell wall hydrolase CwlJ-like protein